MKNKESYLFALIIKTISSEGPTNSTLSIIFPNDASLLMNMAHMFHYYNIQQV